MPDHPFQTIENLGLTELQRRLRTYTGSNARLSEGEALRSGTLAWFQDGVHFDLSFQPLSHLGRKILTALLSDALRELCLPPCRLRLVLALPNHVSVHMVEELMAGFDRAALAEDVIISHVDATASHSHLGIAASLSYSKDDASVRSDHAPVAGDLICISGDVGGAFAGLRILLREKRAWLQHDPTGHVPFQPDLSDYAEVVGRQLSPVPRTDVIRDLKRARIQPGAIWVVKNGLYNDLQQLADYAGIGAEIHASAIPIALTTRDVADELQEDVDRYALLGGEDYELLFTLKQDQVERLQQEIGGVTVIGSVLDREQGVVVHTQE